jgi:hypothetical protein
MENQWKLLQVLCIVFGKAVLNLQQFFVYIYL